MAKWSIIRNRCKVGDLLKFGLFFDSEIRNLEVKSQWFLFPMPDSAQMMQIIMPICGLADPSQWPNSCNLNLYEAVFEGRPGWAWQHGMKRAKIWYRWDWVHSHLIFMITGLTRPFALETFQPTGWWHVGGLAFWWWEPLPRKTGHLTWCAEKQRNAKTVWWKKFPGWTSPFYIVVFCQCWFSQKVIQNHSKGMVDQYFPCIF